MAWRTTLRWAGCEGGAVSGPIIRTYPAAASETFKAGDIIRLIDDGTTKIAVTDETTALGQAYEDASPGVRTLVAVFAPGHLWSIKNSGTAFASPHRDEAAAANLSATVWTCTCGTAGNALFDVVDGDATDATRVLVQVIGSKSQAQGYGTAAADAS